MFPVSVAGRKNLAAGGRVPEKFVPLQSGSGGAVRRPLRRQNNDEQMKIGTIDLGERPVLLAPMEDVTDAPFRLLCKEFGADMVTTEFVSSDALIRAVEKTRVKLSVSDAERPVAIQIYGRDVASMVEAAQLCEAAHPDVIDLNFGCPVRKVAAKGAGAGLLRTPDLLLAITRAVVQAVHLPVTVKTRLGWDADSRIIATLAEQLQDCGIAALAIHGRTRSQMYTGAADWSLIGAVRANPRITIPVIGNGDIATPEAADEAFRRYGVDAVMVGRAAIGAPWIFGEMRSFLRDGRRAELSPAKKMNVLRRLLRDSIARLGERRGILHVRRHLAATPLFKGLPAFRDTRIALLRADSEAQLSDLLRDVETRFF